jgi:hypothetical protein
VPNAIGNSLKRSASRAVIVIAYLLSAILFAAARPFPHDFRRRRRAEHKQRPLGQPLHTPVAPRRRGKSSC